MKQKKLCPIVLHRIGDTFLVANMYSEQARALGAVIWVFDAACATVTPTDI
ncbi:MAG: hypothetical protein ACON3Z_14095 [Bradymonadia bacterium]